MRSKLQRTKKIMREQRLRLLAPLCVLILPGLVWTGAALAGQTPSSPAVTTPQASQNPTPYSRPQFGAEPPDQPNPLAGVSARRLEHMREDERHKRLVADTTKLLEITNQLKTDIDKATKDELSLEVVRKAAEIEKLAHDVKERMKS